MRPPYIIIIISRTTVLFKGVCKKMQLVNISAPNAVAIGHSLNMKVSTYSSGKKHWLSLYKVFVMLKIKGQQYLFLKLFLFV